MKEIYENSHSSGSPAPLAERMRPVKLNDFIGQEHLTGSNKIIRKMIENRQMTSMIFWGPPGVGKTTLARIIATSAQMPYFSLSAVTSGVKDVRSVIEQARASGRALLFIDEIHRFNKAQQDSLLGAVENGILTLIGATTENPSFEVISALLSRCQVFVLNPLDEHALRKVVHRATDQDAWLKAKNIQIKEWEALLQLSNGDARRLLNTLELTVNSLPPRQHEITNKQVTFAVQEYIRAYDKSGEQHFNLISAFIKSVRGSDPNAAVYYLARMVAGGEDPKFIARRLIILASEDIGNANPNALLLATSTFQAVKMIGWPEARIILAQCATYLASSPKSNAAYLAIQKAGEIVKRHGDLPVPLHLRNAPTTLMKNLQYGREYQYAHDFDSHFVPQEYLPEEIQGMCFYTPSDAPSEERIRAFLRARWKEKYGY